MPLLISLPALVFLLTVPVLIVGSIVGFAVGYSEKNYSMLKKFAKVCGKILMWAFIVLFLLVILWGFFNVLSKATTGV
jgi:uncharacterized membrane protein (Fun14 family)